MYLFLQLITKHEHLAVIIIVWRLHVLVAVLFRSQRRHLTSLSPEILLVLPGPRRASLHKTPNEASRAAAKPNAKHNQDNGHDLCQKVFAQARNKTALLLVASLLL